MIYETKSILHPTSKSRPNFKESERKKYRLTYRFSIKEEYIEIASKLISQGDNLEIANSITLILQAAVYNLDVPATELNLRPQFIC